MSAQAVESDDRWEYRAKRQALLDRFGAPGLEEALEEVTDALLREARYHATWPVATAEKWRYDRMLWVFGVMLGEVPADSDAPGPDPTPFDRLLYPTGHSHPAFVGCSEAKPRCPKMED